MSTRQLCKPSMFAHLFAGRGTEDVAQSMWDGYQELRSLVRQDRIIEYTKFHPCAKNPEEAYDKAVSLHNGANSITGKLMNDLVAFGLGYLLSPWDVEVEQKVRVGGKRDIDQMLRLPKGDVYVSTTTIPAERKDATWRQECVQVTQFREVHGIHKPFQFIALFAEPKRNCSLEASIKARELKQQLVGKPSELVCLQDVRHTAGVFSRLLHEFI